ncbi:MAG: NAD-glutamate dehydrogenase, partial [Pseudomonadota bacterium]|nr:NAD-glutamate dehydrogenase [Pseudomonadota bacterium]
MNDMSHDVRSQTMALIQANASTSPGANPQVPVLAQAWLSALDQDDLAGTAPASLAPALLEGFAQAATRNAPGCQIATIAWSDGRGENATALLVINDDMPYLVDSIVMAMRKEKVAVAAVMNAVLPVRRNNAGVAEAVGETG